MNIKLIKHILFTVIVIVGFLYSMALTYTKILLPSMHASEFRLFEIILLPIVLIAGFFAFLCFTYLFFKDYNFVSPTKQAEVETKAAVETEAAKGMPWDSSNMTYGFSSNEEQKEYLMTMAADAPLIKSAIKHQDLNYLYERALFYKKHDYFFETSNLIDIIERIDKHGNFKEQIKELLKDDDIVDDNGNIINPEVRGAISRFETEYLQNHSAKTTLALAEAYHQAGANQLASTHYQEILDKFKRSQEATYAKIRLEEINKSWESTKPRNTSYIF